MEDMSEKLDMRTPFEKARDKRREDAVERFRELMEYSPSVTRSILQVAKEYKVTKETVRLWIIREGAYQKGERGGVGNGGRVIPRQ